MAERDEAKGNEAEEAVFKKKLKKLEMFKGRGTELISVYLPSGADRSSVMGQINEELSQSSNIKSPTTKKNVQGALRKIDGFLKQIDFRLPENGLVIFCGNVSESEGRSDIKLFTIKPPKPLKVKLYRCDSQLYLEPLLDMAQPQEFFGIVTLDKNESTIAILDGKKYEILGHFTSGVAGKSRAGGQSAKRFEHLREEAANDFFKRIGEKINMTFLEFGDKLKGLVIGGPGITKNYFLNKDLIDHRLKPKILGTIDTSYTDESGIRETIQKSDELLKDTAIIKEKNQINDFLGQVVKGNLATYGQREVEEAIKNGRVSLAIISEGIDWMVYRFKCLHCGSIEETIVKDGSFNVNSYKCKSCGYQDVELVEEADYLDWIIEKAKSTGAKVKIISTETDEGAQFLRGFGGIGAILRY